MDCDFSCEKLNQYRVNLPYPDVVTGKNRYYAKLISGAYAGRVSELTAITQYLFHHYYTDAYPQVSTALHYISIVEMTHLDMLGDLINQLGAIPKFGISGTNIYWNGSYPNYKTQISDMLAGDIQGEKDAIAFYQRLISQINDVNINNLLRRIIMDEEKHLEILTPLYLQYAKPLQSKGK